MRHPDFFRGDPEEGPLKKTFKEQAQTGGQISDFFTRKKVGEFVSTNNRVCGYFGASYLIADLIQRLGVFPIVLTTHNKPYKPNVMDIFSVFEHKSRFLFMSKFSEIMIFVRYRSELAL